MNRRAQWLLILMAGGLPAAAAVASEAVAPPQCPRFAPSSFVPINVFDPVALLGPPPVAGSAEQRADVLAVLAAQRAARRAGLTAGAVADSEMTCARFKDVLGAELKSAAAGDALQMIQAGAFSSVAPTQTVKMYWKRQRPFLVSKKVERLADVAPGGEMARGEYPECGSPASIMSMSSGTPSASAAATAQRELMMSRAEFVKNNTSYPSGHAAFGMACGLLLAQAIPEKRAELVARGRQYGQSRIVVGAHFPADVAAGQTAAVLSVALLMQNERYRQQFQQARAQLRAALGYPAALPDLEPNKELFKSPPATPVVPAAPTVPIPPSAPATPAP